MIFQKKPVRKEVNEEDGKVTITGIQRKKIVKVRRKSSTDQKKIPQHPESKPGQHLKNDRKIKTKI